jgi:hypothetical protein
MITITKNKLDPVWFQLRNQRAVQVENQFRVWAQIKNQIWNQVWNNRGWAQIRNQIHDNHNQK